jgi:hypothetical protein
MWRYRCFTPHGRMRMKISLALQPRRPLSRTEAWACFTANLVLPGSGSLIAGRAVGYFQMILAMIGLGISAIKTIQAAIWYFQNYQQLNASMDPLDSMFQLWRALIWPLVGFGIFGVAIVWAMVTSCYILFNSPNTRG